MLLRRRHRPDLPKRDADAGQQRGAGPNGQHVTADRQANAHGGPVPGALGSRAAREGADLQPDIAAARSAHRHPDIEQTAGSDRFAHEHLVTVVAADGEGAARGAGDGRHRDRGPKASKGQPGDECSPRLSHREGIGQALERWERSCSTSTHVLLSGRFVLPTWTFDRRSGPSTAAAERYGVSRARGVSERITRATATTMIAPETSVKAVIRSPRMSAPSATATTGLT